MAKHIILLSDGTGNAASKVWKSNVWRIFESLDLRGSEQVAFYDNGVGTSSFKPLAILGGAFGWGLKRNIIAFNARGVPPGQRPGGWTNPTPGPPSRAGVAVRSISVGAAQPHWPRRTNILAMARMTFTSVTSTHEAGVDND